MMKNDNIEDVNFDFGTKENGSSKTWVPSPIYPRSSLGQINRYAYDHAGRGMHA